MPTTELLSHGFSIERVRETVAVCEVMHILLHRIPIVMVVLNEILDFSVYLRGGQ